MPLPARKSRCGPAARSASSCFAVALALVAALVLTSSALISCASTPAETNSPLPEPGPDSATANDADAASARTPAVADSARLPSRLPSLIDSRPPRNATGLAVASFAMRDPRGELDAALIGLTEPVAGPKGAWLGAGLKIQRVSAVNAENARRILQAALAQEDRVLLQPAPGRITDIYGEEIPRSVGTSAAAQPIAPPRQTPATLIRGPRQWLTEASEWRELARGSELGPGEVLAMHDGRFAAPPGSMRLLGRMFFISRDRPALVLELAPQLLSARTPDDDLDLASPALRSQFARGMVLDRLIGSVELAPGELLFITAPYSPPTAAPADDGSAMAEADALSPRPTGQVRSTSPSEPPRQTMARSPGPVARGPSPFGPSDDHRDGQPVRTIGEALFLGPAVSPTGPSPTRTTRAPRGAPLRSLLVIDSFFAKDGSTEPAATPAR